MHDPCSVALSWNRAANASRARTGSGGRGNRQAAKASMGREAHAGAALGWGSIRWHRAHVRGHCSRPVGRPRTLSHRITLHRNDVGGRRIGRRDHDSNAQSKQEQHQHQHQQFGFSIMSISTGDDDSKGREPGPRERRPLGRPIRPPASPRPCCLASLWGGMTRNFNPPPPALMPHAPPSCGKRSSSNSPGPALVDPAWWNSVKGSSTVRPPPRFRVPGTPGCICEHSSRPARADSFNNDSHREVEMQ